MPSTSLEEFRSVLSVQPDIMGNSEKTWQSCFPRHDPAHVVGRFMHAAGRGHTASLAVSRSQEQSHAGRSGVGIRVYHDKAYDVRSPKDVMYFTIEGDECRIRNVEFSRSNMARGIAKNYMREIAGLACEMECKTMTLSTGKAIGGYAWPRYGFYPAHAKDWENVKRQMRDKLKPYGKTFAIRCNGVHPVSESDYLAIQRILNDKNKPYPQLMNELMELQTPIGEVGGHRLTVAKALLLSTDWEAKLDLAEGHPSFEQFKAYTGFSPTKSITR